MQTIATLIGYLTGGVVMALLVGIYILPTIVAFYRKKRNRWNIAFFNIVLGWTVIAWGAMIVECFKSDDAP